MPSNFRHALVLVAGSDHYYAIGKNEFGQLGTNDQNKANNFVRVNVKVPFLSISAGYRDHSVAVAIDGTLWSWGSNSRGQLGLSLNESAQIHVPTKIPNTSNFIQVTAAQAFNVALDLEGAVWVFGSIKGTLWPDCQSNFWNEPFRTPLQDTRMISAGTRSFATLDHSGQVSFYGEQRHRLEGITTPVQMISCGYYHVLLLDSEMKLWNVNESVQEIEHSLSNIVHICCGGFSSIIHDSEGRVWVIGRNSHGEICSETPTPLDMRISTLQQASHWVDHYLIPGGDHTVAIDPNGEVTILGSFSGQPIKASLVNIGSQPRFSSISNVKSARSA